VEGLIFHTLQRFWFRFLVDGKLWERERAPARLLNAPTERRSLYAT
jgi:hypothetical protein